MTSQTKYGIYALVVVCIILAGCIFILLGNSIELSIGTSLIASIVGALDLFRRRMIRSDNEGDALIRSGIVAVYPHRTLAEYHLIVPEVRGTLDISGYSLSHFHASFSHILAQHARNNANLRIRILMVDPNSHASKSREGLDRHPTGAFMHSLDNLRDTFGALPNVEIRCLNSYIGTTMMRVDDTMFVGPILYSLIGAATATLKLRRTRDAWLFHLFQTDFEEMWRKASSVERPPLS